jgi:hypothetical protein
MCLTFHSPSIAFAPLRRIFGTGLAFGTSSVSVSFSCSSVSGNTVTARRTAFPFVALPYVVLVFGMGGIADEVVVGDVQTVGLSHIFFDLSLIYPTRVIHMLASRTRARFFYNTCPAHTSRVTLTYYTIHRSFNREVSLMVCESLTFLYHNIWGLSL